MRRFLLPVLLLATLAAPAVAQASYQDVIKDCLDPAHGEQLTKTYKIKEYQAALDHMPTDAKEYTGCYDVIRSAMRNVATGGSGTGGTGGDGGTGAGGTGTGGTGTGTGTGGTGAAPTAAANPLAVASPADRAAAEQAVQLGAAPVRVGAAMITPGDPGTTASSLGDLPTPLLVVLALALVAGLAGLALLIKNLVLRRTSP